MKKFLPIIIITCLLQIFHVSAEPNHGPVIKAFYAPYGAGSYRVPYDRTINGGYNNDLVSDSEETKDNQLKTLTGYSFSCGYFYDWLQADITYTAIETKDQYVKEVSTINSIHYADASMWNADFRIGYRFDDPGDTSYNWLYIGMRRSHFDISFNNTEVDATGFLAGFYGFHSYGLHLPVELVLTYDINLTFYRKNFNHLKTDVNIDPDRKRGVDLGLSAGIGLQYEPCDIAVILKISPFISDKYYKADNYGNTSVTMSGTLIGIEVVFSIPEYKNNIVE
jgi:hypothetical protein